MLETARESLRHSCRSELTRQGISLPLDRYSYGRRLLELILNANKHIQCFAGQHWAGVRPYTSSCDLAESCVFDKQSLPPFLLYSHLVAQIEPCLSRSYACSLPSSFSTISSYASVYSTRSPVSVYGTAINSLKVFQLASGRHINPIRLDSHDAKSNRQLAHEY